MLELRLVPMAAAQRGTVPRWVLIGGRTIGSVDFGANGWRAESRVEGARVLYTRFLASALRYLVAAYLDVPERALVAEIAVTAEEPILGCRSCGGATSRLVEGRCARCKGRIEYGASD